MTNAKQLSLSFSLSVLVLLTGCGGGGGGSSDDDDFISGDVGQSGAAVASVDEGQIPGYHSGSSVSHLVATNNGLYMQMGDATGTTILKVHGNPIFDNWSAVRFSHVYDFAPLSPYSERDDEFSFYWAGGDKKWGLYTENTGTPGVTEQDDLTIRRVAAGGRQGISTSRPWVVAKDNAYNLGGNYWVYQDDGAYTAGFNASNRFSTPAGSNTFTHTSGLVLLSHPTEPRLFVGDGTALHVYSASGIESSVNITADDAFQYFNQFLWYDGELWMGFGNRILRRAADGRIYDFAEIEDPAYMAGGALGGRFCITGGEVLTVDGRAISIAHRTERSWISKGNLSPAQQSEADILRATLSGGIYCSPDTTGSAVYALSTVKPGVIRMIHAL